MMKLALCVGIVFVASSIALADDKEDLGKATKKFSEAESYTFKMTIEIEGSPMPMDPIEFEGKYKKDIASYVSGSIMGRDFEAYRNGEKIAMRNQDGDWTDAPNFGGQRRPRAEGEGEGEQPQRPRANRGGRGGMARNLKPPHEELASFEDKIEKLKKSEKTEAVDHKDCSIYEGGLSEEAAKEMVPMGMGRMMGNMGNAEITGSAKLWVSEESVIIKYEFKSTIKVDFQGNEMEITSTRTVEVSKIGETDVKLPDEVKKLWEEKKESEGKEGETQPQEKKEKKRDDF